MSAIAALLTNTATLLQAGSTTDYGNPAPSWTSGTTSTAGIAGRLMPIGGQLAVELAAEQPSGAVIADYVWYMAYGDAPAALLAFGVTDMFRLTTVCDANGTSLDAGPFDVKAIDDQAGAQHHLRVLLSRIG